MQPMCNLADSVYCEANLLNVERIWSDIIIVLCTQKKNRNNSEQTLYEWEIAQIRMHFDKNQTILKQIDAKSQDDYDKRCFQLPHQSALCCFAPFLSLF